MTKEGQTAPSEQAALDSPRCGSRHPVGLAVGETIIDGMDKPKGNEGNDIDSVMHYKADTRRQSCSERSGQGQHALYYQEESKHTFSARCVPKIGQGWRRWQ